MEEVGEGCALFQPGLKSIAMIPCCQGSHLCHELCTSMLPLRSLATAGVTLPMNNSYLINAPKYYRYKKNLSQVGKYNSR